MKKNEKKMQLYLKFGILKRRGKGNSYINRIFTQISKIEGVKK